MKNILKLTAFLAIIIMGGSLLQGCGSKKEVMQEAVVDLSGNWSLNTLNGKDVASLFKGTIPSMTIDQSKHSISGNGGCNNFMGSYTYEEGRFNAPQLAGTFMLCPEENSESELMQVLTTESIVKLIGDKLIFYKQGKKVAEFVRAIDTVLLSGEWTLESLGDDSASSLFKDGEVPTLTFFTSDKRISGFAGCNRYNSSFTLNGYTLNVGAIVTTRMACPGVMQSESDFIQALSNTSTLSIKGNILELSKGGKVVLRFTKDKE